MDVTAAAASSKPIKKVEVKIIDLKKDDTNSKLPEVVKSIQQKMSMYRNSMVQQSKNTNNNNNIKNQWNQPQRVPQSSLGSMEPLSLTDCSLIKGINEKIIHLKISRHIKNKL